MTAPTREAPTRLPCALCAGTGVDPWSAGRDYCGCRDGFALRMHHVAIGAYPGSPRVTLQTARVLPQQMARALAAPPPVVRDQIKTDALALYEALHDDED